MPVVTPPFLIIALSTVAIIHTFAKEGASQPPKQPRAFANAVVEVHLTDSPSPEFAAPSNALGASDTKYVSLGYGGSITLRFTDTLLSGSGTPDADLWVFEVGGAREDTTVEVSKDARTWSSVGQTKNDSGGIDIDAFGFGPTAAIAYVRITDARKPREYKGGGSPGADLDAVGILSAAMPTTVIPPQPVPSSSQQSTPAPIAKTSTPVPRPPAPTPPPKIDRVKTDPLEGRWRQNNSTVTTILPNGYAKNNAPGKPQYDGTWTRDGSAYVINWNGGLFVDRVMIRADNELWRKGGDNRWHEMAKRLP